MKHTLTACGMALAAFATTASAQSTVAITGGVDLRVLHANDLNTVETAGSSRSNLTFTSSEDLGGGWRALAVLNHRFRPDDGLLNQGAVQSAGTTQFWRHSFVQLGGPLGAVRLGRYLSPLQEVNGAYDPWGTDTAATTHVGGINSGSRYNNLVEYRAPAFFGIQAVAAMATREDNVNGAASGALAPSKPAGVYVRYNSGSVDASVAWDRNGDGRKTVGAYGSYDFGVAKLWGQFEKGDIAPTGSTINSIGVGRPSQAGVTSVKRYAASVSAPVGAAVLKLGYGFFDEEQVHKIGVGGDYFLSKRTNLYVNVAKLGGDNTTLTDVNRKVRADIGIWHRF